MPRGGRADGERGGFRDHRVEGATFRTLALLAAHPEHAIFAPFFHRDGESPAHADRFQPGAWLEGVPLLDGQRWTLKDPSWSEPANSMPGLLDNYPLAFTPAGWGA